MPDLAAVARRGTPVHVGDGQRALEPVVLEHPRRLVAAASASAGKPPAVGASTMRRSSLPMHVTGGLGMLFLIVREPMPSGNFFAPQVRHAGPGESTYTRYDRDITAEAVRWIEHEAPRHRGTPWCLFVSLVAPHPPFVAPERFYALYDHARLPFPHRYWPDERPMHPAYTDLRHFWGVEQPFTEAEVRNVTAAYLGLVSFLDDNIGQLLAALERAGLTDDTNVLYTSDHGESLGHQGLFSKSNFTEQSANVPMILAGPGVPENAVVHTPASLVDCFPTVLEATGTPLAEEDADLPGASLFDLARGEAPGRAVLSEQHAAGARDAGFMIRKGRFKYVHYTRYPPLLYDLAKDPLELHDVAGDPAYAAALSECEATLRERCDPEDVERRARADQQARVEAGGGAQEVLRSGAPGYTPAPGEEPEFVA